MKLLKCLILLGSLAGSLLSQTIEDGVMMGKQNLFIGNLYSHDSWDHYWEGSLNRVNGNIGTLTTQTSTLFANYGVTNRLNVIAMVPYVSTDASQGVLAGQAGWQDATVAAKYSFIDRPFTKIGSLRIIGVGAATIPMTDYNPDFQPLSIGNHSKRITGRLTVNFQASRGWFVNASGGYTWRSDVSLDRPYYYTNNQFYRTNIVEMPYVLDYIASAGYFKHGVMADFSFAQQRTQGGGDIRPQDMPFISNHVNFSKIGALIMVPLPAKRLRNIAVQFSYTHAVQGRSAPLSTTYTTGLLYTLHFHRRSPHQ